MVTVPCDCEGANPGSTTLDYDGSASLACRPTIFSYYPAGNNDNAREADFICGAASVFNVPAMPALGQGDQEDGGHTMNWLQLGLTSPNVPALFAADFMTSTNNITGVPFSTSDALTADSINAAVAMWYLRLLLNDAHSNEGYSGLDQLKAGLNNYNSGSPSLTQAYAASVLWKAYGSAWDNPLGETPPSAPTTYGGAYMATGPAGMQCQAATGNGETSASLPTPSFEVPRKVQTTPLGKNAAGKRTVIFVKNDAPIDYASSIIIEQWYFGTKNYKEAYLTADVVFAARCAVSVLLFGLDNCVICVGGPAVSAIQAEATKMGFTLTPYGDFASWEIGTLIAPGFIDCAGSGSLESYNCGLTAAKASAAAGWG
ncbi:MAG: hypothetical protein WA938_08880 [Candidatus Dormiibacterota bacterium]